MYNGTQSLNKENNSHRLILSKGQKKIYKPILTPRSFENSHVPGPVDLSVEEINRQRLEQELARIRDLYETERNDKWRVMQEKNLIENSLKIFNAEKDNALHENSKLRGQLRGLIQSNQRINSEKIMLLNDCNAYKNKEDRLNSKIQSLEKCLSEFEKQRNQYIQVYEENNRLQINISKLYEELQRAQHEKELSQQTNQALLFQNKHFQDRIQSLPAPQVFQENKTLQKELNTLKKQLIRKEHENEEMRKVFERQKQQFQNKIQTLSKTLNQKLKADETKLNEICELTQRENQKLYQSLNCPQNMDIEALEAKIRFYQSELYHKEMRIQDLSRQCLETKRQFQTHNLRPNFGKQSINQMLSPKQFNLLNQIESQRLKIEQLETKNQDLQSQFDNK